MNQHAEYVSPGPPDRLADAIAESIVTAAPLPALFLPSCRLPRSTLPFSANDRGPGPEKARERAEGRDSCVGLRLQ